MRTLIKTAILISLSLTSASAFAGGNYNQIRAWIAESMEWRQSYLPRVYQDADVVSLAPENFFSFQGAATLERTRNSVKGRVMTNVATAGDAYTLWIMVINNPGACATTPCSPPDLFNPETETTAYYGAGAISADNGSNGGVVNFGFDTTAGALPDGQFVLFAFGDAGIHRGNGFSSEIALIVDKHPPIADGESWLADLTSTVPPDFMPAYNHRLATFLAVE